MDENTFDDLIKERMQEYEDPQLEDSSLSDFHSRMSAYKAAPWYSVYQPQIWIASGIILFTLLNGFISWFGIHRAEQISNDFKHDIKFQLIDSLGAIISDLKNNQRQAAVYIADPAKQQRSKSDLTEKIEPTSNKYSLSEYQMSLGRVSLISPGLYKKLLQAGMVEEENGEAFLLIPEKKMLLAGNNDFTNIDLSPLHPTFHFVIPESENQKLQNLKPVTGSHAAISGKTRDAIEKHYFSGVGIEVAPHSDFLRQNFSGAIGAMGIRPGLTSDWIVSPHLSIEAGVDYFKTKFVVNKDFERLRSFNPVHPVGTLKSIEVSNTTLSLPIAIKYRQWISAKSQVFFKGGFTHYLSLRHSYLYSYAIENNTPDTDITINKTDEFDNTGFYGRSFMFSTGVTRTLKDSRKFEASLFYEKTTGRVGDEKMSLQMFGIRTAYWFKLK